MGGRSAYQLALFGGRSCRACRIERLGPAGPHLPMSAAGRSQDDLRHTIRAFGSRAAA
jgi:hypothetical protein